MAESEDLEELNRVQHLKAALHYSIGKVAETVQEEQGITVSRQVIAAVSELTFRQIKLFSEDLECFAKHAKRSVINVEDVKLLVRKSPNLAEHIASKALELRPAVPEKRKSSKKKAAVAEGENLGNEESMDSVI